MRRLVLFASLAALAIPSLAGAQPSCEQQRSDSKVAGTFLGAGIGALIGGSVAGHNNRGVGAVAGAIGGGLIGNAASGDTSCGGYYDSHGAWRTSAGYYDGDGRWVGRTGGYYDGDRWVANGPDGYYDVNGRWVPYARSAGGYGVDTSYTGGALNDRLDSLSRHIHLGDARGALSRDEADSAYRDLNAIRRQQSRLIDMHGGLTMDDRADLNARVDNLSDDISSEWNR